MKSYVDFAMFYDTLTTDVDYKKRAEYILKIFKKFDKAPTLLLDIACGTGSFSNEFAKKGIQVIGVDASEEMLSVAAEKSRAQGNDILFLHQRAEELELYGTVDSAVCCLDSLNHITDYSLLKRSLKKIALFLERDRLFVFDVNTEYKHRAVLGNNTFVKENEGVFCVWQNNYNPQKRLTEVNIDFFAKENDGKYSRYSENFFERAYSEAEFETALSQSGFKIEAIFGEMTFLPPENDTQRIIYVARRV